MLVQGRIIAALAVLGLLGGGCVSTGGSSFATLGVPEAEPPPGRGVVIIGWQAEVRDGWSVRYVTVDGRRSAAWDRDSQRPAVLPVEPGERTLQIRAVQYEAEDGRASGRRRSYRARPATIEVAAGEVHVCVVRLGGRRRIRPRLRCALQEPAAAAPASTGAAAGPAPTGAARATAETNARLRALEARIVELQQAVTRMVDSRPAEVPPDGGTGTLEIAVAPDLDVDVDGRPLPASAGGRVELPAGQHRVKVTGEGVLPFEAIVPLERGKTVLLVPVITKRAHTVADTADHGFLNLSSVPWAEVYDGRHKIGTTPLVKAKLPVGLRRIKLVPEGHGKAWTIAVAISPAEITRCNAVAGSRSATTCEIADQ